MNRIADKFRELRRRHRKALIPFFTAGDPHPKFTVPLMHALVEAGADLICAGSALVKAVDVNQAYGKLMAQVS